MRSPVGRGDNSFFKNRPKAYGLKQSPKVLKFLQVSGFHPNQTCMTYFVKIDISDCYQLEKTQSFIPKYEHYYYDQSYKDSLLSDLECNGLDYRGFIDKLEKDQEELANRLGKLRGEILSFTDSNMDMSPIKAKINQVINTAQKYLTSLELLYYVELHVNNQSYVNEKLTEKNTALLNLTKDNIILITKLFSQLQDHPFFDCAEEQEIWRKLFFISETLLNSKIFLIIENSTSCNLKENNFLGFLNKSYANSGLPFNLNYIQQIMGEHLQSSYEYYSFDVEEKHVFGGNSLLLSLHLDFSLLYLVGSQIELSINQLERAIGHFQLSLAHLSIHPEIPQAHIVLDEQRQHIVYPDPLQAGFPQIGELEYRIGYTKVRLDKIKTLFNSLEEREISHDLRLKLATLKETLPRQEQILLEKQELAAQEKTKISQESLDKAIILSTIAKIENAKLAKQKSTEASKVAITSEKKKSKLPKKKEIVTEKFNIPPISPAVSPVIQTPVQLPEQKNLTERIPASEQEKNSEERRRKFLQKNKQISETIHVTEEKEEKTPDVLWDFPVQDKQIKPILDEEACITAKLTDDEIKKLKSMLTKSYTIGKTPHLRMATSSEIRSLNLDSIGEENHWIKLRPLGKYGDLRTYGKISKQPSQDGHYEIFFNVINPSAHKKLERGIASYRP